MPLALKNISGLQKFRIPFKNLSEHDFEVEFSFIQASKAVSLPALKRTKSTKSSSDESIDSHESPIDFNITPNVVKIPAGVQAVMLNITAKLKNSYQLESESSSLLQRANSEPLPERSSSLKNVSATALPSPSLLCE